MVGMRPAAGVERTEMRAGRDDCEQRDLVGGDHLAEES